MKNVRWSLALAACLGLGAVALLACDGGAAIGESCTATGSVDECEDGAVCDTDTAGIVCLKICTSDEGCASNEACNGVSGSNIKACHVKTK